MVGTTAEPEPTRHHWLDRLYPYQDRGALRLLAGDSLLLADDMGLGKTIQAIAALRILHETNALGPSLVVVPAALIPQWRSQFYEWAPSLRVSTVYGNASDRAWQWRAPVDVYIVSYGALRSDFSTNPHSPVAREWDVVILDEAQKIKNRDVETARAPKGLKRKRAWALTGTPMETKLDDLASILEFTQRNTDDHPAVSVYVGPALLDHQARVQLRRRKEDVLPDLPPKTVVEVPIELTPQQRRQYDQAERDGIMRLRALGDQITITDVRNLVVALKQICNFCPETAASAKVDDVLERMDEIVAAGHRAILFSQFVREPFGLLSVAERLSGFRPLLYHGGQDQAERTSVLRRFDDDESCQILLLSLRAGGLGLNLQQASYVFHFDRWWNPAVERQAEDRVHRAGQQRGVTVYTYVAQGTVEERIAKVLKDRESLFDAVVDRDLGRGISGDDLFALFDLEVPNSQRGQPALETPEASE